MIHEATTFLANVANEEPGTFVDFILSVCSDLERSARRLISQAQTDVARPAGDAVSDNTMNTDTVALEQQQPADYAEQGDSNGSDNFTGSYPDLFIAQGSAPPFWNLQDIFTGVPLSPEWNR